MEIIYKRPEPECKESMNSIEELKYFNPLEPLTHKFNLLYSSVNPCYFDYLRQLFLAMACYNDKEKPFILTSSALPSEELCKDLSPNKLQILKRRLGNLNNAGMITRHKQFTKEDISRLNKDIKKLKTNIGKYINIIKHYKQNVILYDYLDNNYERPENADKYRNKVPYIYYLQELLQIFRMFSDAKDKKHIIFDDLRKTFKFRNYTQLINFQGYLGLLLMNHFCKYYKNKELNYSILCAMLMANLCIYSPLHKKIERKKSKITKKLLLELETQKNNRVKGAYTRDLNNYRQFREYFKELQRKEYLKNPKLTANSFATSFHNNPPIKIPYVEKNQLKTLRRLAEENNREFRKIYGDKKIS